MSGPNSRSPSGARECPGGSCHRAGRPSSRSCPGTSQPTTRAGAMSRSGSCPTRSRRAGPPRFDGPTPGIVQEPLDQLLRSLVERAPVAPTLRGLRVDHQHRGDRLSVVLHPDDDGEPGHRPFRRPRLLATGASARGRGPVAVPLGEVAPLAGRCEPETTSRRPSTGAGSAPARPVARAGQRDRRPTPPARRSGRLDKGDVR